MESIRIEGTQDSPEVIFDFEKGNFTLSGESRPENAQEFFNPLMAVIEQYCEELETGKIPAPSEIKFDFRLDYFNSVSDRYFAEILAVLDNFNTKGPYKFTIAWWYDNDLMLEAGEELDMLIGSSIEFKQVD